MWGPSVPVFTCNLLHFDQHTCCLPQHNKEMDLLHVRTVSAGTNTAGWQPNATTVPSVNAGAGGDTSVL